MCSTLKEAGVDLDTNLAIYFMTKDNEPGMKELLKFVEANNPTPREILEKTFQIFWEFKAKN